MWLSVNLSYLCYRKIGYTLLRPPPVNDMLWSFQCCICFNNLYFSSKLSFLINLLHSTIPVTRSELTQPPTFWKGLDSITNEVAWKGIQSVQSAKKNLRINIRETSQSSRLAYKFAPISGQPGQSFLPVHITNNEVSWAGPVPSHHVFVCPVMGSVGTRPISGGITILPARCPGAQWSSKVSSGPLRWPAIWFGTVMSSPMCVKCYLIWKTGKIPDFASFRPFFGQRKLNVIGFDLWDQIWNPFIGEYT